MREAKDFWSHVDEDSLTSSSSSSSAFNRSGLDGGGSSDLDLDLRRRRFYSNPATASLPGWMVPRYISLCGCSVNY